MLYLGSLSSSFYAAEQAADMVREKYPDFEIYVVDNGAPSRPQPQLLGLGGVFTKPIRSSAKEIAEWAKETKSYSWLLNA